MPVSLDPLTFCRQSRQTTTGVGRTMGDMSDTRCRRGAHKNNDMEFGATFVFAGLLSRAPASGTTWRGSARWVRKPCECGAIRDGIGGAHVEFMGPSSSFPSCRTQRTLPSLACSSHSISILFFSRTLLLAEERSAARNVHDCFASLRTC